MTALSIVTHQEKSDMDQDEQDYQALPLDPIWRQAAQEVIAEFRYGDIIPLDWLQNHLNIKRPTGAITYLEHQALAFEMLSRIEGLRDELLTRHRRYLQNIRGVGYKIVEPPRQTQVAMAKLQKELRRAIAQTMSALVHVNETALSLEDARANAEARAKVADFALLHQKKLSLSAKKNEKENHD